MTELRACLFQGSWSQYLHLRIHLSFTLSPTFQAFTMLSDFTYKYLSYLFAYVCVLTSTILTQTTLVNPLNFLRCPRQAIYIQPNPTIPFSTP